MYYVELSILDFAFETNKKYFYHSCMRAEQYIITKMFLYLDLPTPLSPIIKIFKVVKISPSSILAIKSITVILIKLDKLLCYSLAFMNFNTIYDAVLRSNNRNRAAKNMN